MPFLGKTPSQIVDPEVDIDGGTIDGVSIGSVTANAGAFTNLTATGTLTLPDDGISGDDVNGGTISNFASTGIDDNATSAAITIDSSQRVGIGIASPSNTLTVNKDTGSTPTVYINNSGVQATEGAALKVQATGRGSGIADTSIFSVHNNADELFTVRNDGNVGIGTTSPLNQLVISEGTGQHGIELAPGTTSYIQAYDRAISDYGDLKIDAQIIQFGTDIGAERMRIDASGNVGYNGKLFSSNDLTALGGLQLYRDHATGSCYLFDTTSAPYSGPLIFGTNNAERMRILSTGGITFNGDTATANALDDYEEGTWTVSANTVNNNASISISNTTGYYIKVGHTVTCWWYSGPINVSSAGTGYGKITGFPYSSKNLYQGYATGVHTHNTFSNSPSGYLIPNTDTYVLMQPGLSTNGAPLIAGNPLYMMLTVTYYAA
jgi:hypothetical protein